MVTSANLAGYDLKLTLPPMPVPLAQNLRAIAVQSVLSVDLPLPVIRIINGYSTIACPIEPQLGRMTMILCHRCWSPNASWIPPTHVLFDGVDVSVTLSAAFFGDEAEAEAMAREIGNLNFPRKASIVNLTQMRITASTQQTP